MKESEGQKVIMFIDRFYELGAGGDGGSGSSSMLELPAADSEPCTRKSIFNCSRYLLR